MLAARGASAARPRPPPARGARRPSAAALRAPARAPALQAPPAAPSPRRPGGAGLRVCCAPLAAAAPRGGVAARKAPTRERQAERDSLGAGAPQASQPLPAAAAAGTRVPAPPPLRAVVAGAGPAGVAAAIYLARRGWCVDVFERRQENSPSDARRTYLIGLGERGLRALEGAGVSLPGAARRRLVGSVYMTKDRRYEDVWTDDVRIVGVDRAGLTADLVAAARRDYPSAIAFHFGARLGAVDFDRRAASFAGADGDEAKQEVAYDLLIGADGARSEVRAQMARALPGMSVSRLSSPVAAMEYKAFHDLPGGHAPMDPLLPEVGRSSPERGSFFFALTNPTPDNPSPGSVTLYVNARGNWSGVMYQPAGGFTAVEGDAAAHAAAVRRLVPPGFPEEWVAEMARQMAEEGPSGVTPMHQPSRIAWPAAGCVLIGDAAHNVTPQLGQGCNSALEDARMLDQALASAAPEAAAAAAADAAGSGVPPQAGSAAAADAVAKAAPAAAAPAVADALGEYERVRLPQAHALQRIEEENAWARRPPAPGREPARMTYMRAAWGCAALLLAAAAALPRPGGRGWVPASLFENVMAATAPYDRLHWMVRAAPPAAALLAGGAAWAAWAGAAAALRLLAGGA